MVHTQKFSAKGRARLLATNPTDLLAAEEKLKQLFRSGALRGIVQYGSLPPRARPVPQGRPRDPVTGEW